MKIMLTETMGSGTPLVSDLSARMQHPYVYVAFAGSLENRHKELTVEAGRWDNCYPAALRPETAEGNVVYPSGPNGPPKSVWSDS